MIYNHSQVVPLQIPILSYEESQREDLQKKNARTAHLKEDNRQIPWEGKSARYHDLFFVLAYCTVIIGFFVLAFTSVHQSWIQNISKKDIFFYIGESLQIKDIDIPNVVILFGLIVTQTLVLCFGVLLLMFFLCRIFVVLGLIANIGLGVWGTVLCLQSGNIWLGVASFCLTSIFGWAAWRTRRKIAFSVQVLNVLSEVMRKNASVWLVLFVGIFSSWCFALFYLVTSTLMYTAWANNKSMAVYAGIALCWIFCGYYITEINKGVLCLSVSAVFSKWYYMSDTSTISVIFSLLARCFGSICFGSLLVSVVQFMRECLAAANNAFQSKQTPMSILLMYLLNGALGFMEWLMQYFNEYSFSYMSIHATGYLKSSKKVFRLFKTKGLDLLANDCIINMTLKMYLSIVTTSAAFTAYLYIALIQPQFKYNKGYAVTVMAISSLTAFQIGRTLLNVINAGVHTLFICLTESPEAFQKNHSKLAESFSNPLDKYRGLSVV